MPKQGQVSAPKFQHSDSTGRCAADWISQVRQNKPWCEAAKNTKLCSGAAWAWKEASLQVPYPHRQEKFQQLMAHFKDSFTTQHEEFHIQPWSDSQQRLHLGQVSLTKKCTHISPRTKISYHKLVYKTVTGFIEINTNRKLHRFFILTKEWHFQSVPT